MVLHAPGAGVLVGEGVIVGVKVPVGVLDGVGVWVGVLVGVFDGVGVCVGVAVGVKVPVGVIEGVGVLVGVLVGVCVGVRVGVFDGVGVDVEVGVLVGVEEGIVKSKAISHSAGVGPLILKVRVHSGLAARGGGVLIASCCWTRKLISRAVIPSPAVPSNNSVTYQYFFSTFMFYHVEALLPYTADE